MYVRSSHAAGCRRVAHRRNYPRFCHISVLPRYGQKPGKKVYIIFGIFIVLAAAFVAFVELYDFPADIDAENYASGLKNAYMILFCAIGLMLTFFIDTKSMSASPRRPCGGRR